MAVWGGHGGPKSPVAIGGGRGGQQSLWGPGAALPQHFPPRRHPFSFCPLASCWTPEGRELGLHGPGRL